MQEKLLLHGVNNGVKMSISLQAINNILVQEDIEGFIAHGAPEDEYITEANKIFQFLENIKNSANAQDIIYQSILTVWENSFDLKEEDMALRLAAITNVTENIVKKL